MKIRTKNALWILVGFLIALGIAVGIYLYFSNQPAGQGLSQIQEGIRSFNPFGVSDEEPEEELPVATTTPEEQVDKDEVEVSYDPSQVVQQVTDMPAAGAQIVIQNDTPTLQYVNRTDGHVVAVDLETGIAQKISNTTIPRVQEVVWGNTNTLAYRYLVDEAGEVAGTFSGSLIRDAETNLVGSLSATAFPWEISQIDFNGAGDQLFYINTTTEGGSRGILTDPTHGAPAEIFSSSIREWLLRWGHDQTVELTTKPSNGVPGQFFLFNVNSRTMNRVLRDIPALTTLGSPDLSRVAYSGSDDSFTLHIRNVETGEDIDTSVRTLPEKCIWISNEALYCAVPQTMPAGMPDTWYQGRATLTDTLWRINATTGLGEQVAVPNEAVDMTDLSTLGTGEFVSFINKQDNTLWLYQLVTAPSSPSN